MFAVHFEIISCVLVTWSPVWETLSECMRVWIWGLPFYTVHTVWLGQFISILVPSFFICEMGRIILIYQLWSNRIIYVKGFAWFLAYSRCSTMAFVVILKNGTCLWWGFSDGSVVNEPARQCRRYRFDPWVGKTPWRRKWQPTPIFLPRKSHGQRSLAATVHGVAESDTLIDQTTTTCLWYFPQSLAFSYKRSEPVYSGRGVGRKCFKISKHHSLAVLTLPVPQTIKKLSRWRARQCTGKKQSALWSENLFGNWDHAASGRGPWSTRNSDWFCWNSVSSDLNCILQMCLFALVVGHDTPNQGSIIQNRAGPPAVGEQKPMSCLLSYSENLRLGITSDALPAVIHIHREGRAQSPRGKFPRCPLLACGTAWAGLLQSFRHSVSIYKIGIGCWFLSHRVDVRIKWDCLVRQSPQYSMNDNFYCYHC